VGGEVIPKSGLRAHFKRGDIMTDGVNNNKPSSPASGSKGKTKTRRASDPKRRRRTHKDSVHIAGRRKVTFSRGRNGHGARIDGRKQILKKKKSDLKRGGA